jgi:hypothetical protein
MHDIVHYAAKSVEALAHVNGPVVQPETAGAVKPEHCRQR